MMDSTRDDGSARPSAAAREAPRAADDDPHAVSMDQVGAVSFEWLKASRGFCAALRLPPATPIIREARAPRFRPRP